MLAILTATLMAILTAVLAGCADGSSGASAGASTSASRTIAPSPASTPLTSPERVVAALAAVNASTAAYNAMSHTLDPAAYEATFTSGCKPCRDNVTQLDDIRRAHGTITGGRIELSQLRATHVGLTSVVVRGIFRQRAVTVRRGSKVLVHQHAGAPDPVTWTVTVSGGRWRVSRMTFPHT